MKKRRLLSLALSLALVVSLFSLSALAADDGVTGTADQCVKSYRGGLEEFTDFGEPCTLYLGGKTAGEFTLLQNENGSYALLNADGLYLAFDSSANALMLAEEPCWYTEWLYDGGLYQAVGYLLDLPMLRDIPSLRDACPSLIANYYLTLNDEGSVVLGGKSAAATVDYEIVYPSHAFSYEVDQEGHYVVCANCGYTGEHEEHSYTTESEDYTQPVSKTAALAALEDTETTQSTNGCCDPFGSLGGVCVCGRHEFARVQVESKLSVSPRGFLFRYNQYDVTVSAVNAVSVEYNLGWGWQDGNTFTRCYYPAVFSLRTTDLLGYVNLWLVVNGTAVRIF